MLIQGDNKFSNVKNHTEMTDTMDNRDNDW